MAIVDLKLKLEKFDTYQISYITYQNTKHRQIKYWFRLI